MKNYDGKKVAAVTLGCKLNYAETSTILHNLCEQGWQLASIKDNADLIIIHSCAVTRQAEQKCRQKIRSIIRKNPESSVAVIGCYAQLHPEILSEINGIDAILGSNDKFKTEWYNQITNNITANTLIRVTPARSLETVYPGASLPTTLSNERTRAFLKIQDGCDYGCSYCTIPLIRGKSRSIPSEQIVEQTRLLAASGYQEIVVTGVNVGDYHYNHLKLCDLLQQLETVNIRRIRISSVEPDVVNHELIDLVASSKKIVPHFHIPLQHGSDTILNAMRRRYDTATYKNKVLKAVELIAECAIGTDVMVGYPGESEEDFETMYRFIEALPLAYLHIFSCSIRPGTALARQIELHAIKPVAPEVITNRHKRLADLGDQKELMFKKQAVGKKYMVLFEAITTRKDGITQCSGYTPNYLRVVVDSREQHILQPLAGREAEVLIHSLDDDLNLKGLVLS